MTRTTATHISTKPKVDRKQFHNHLAGLVVRYLNKSLSVADIILTLEVIRIDLILQVNSWQQKAGVKREKHGRI